MLTLTEVYGANGSVAGDTGDILCYSAAAGDVNADGRDDLITNEMTGNGAGGSPVDVGNLIVLSGQILGIGPPPIPTTPSWALAVLGVLLLLGSLFQLRARLRVGGADRLAGSSNTGDSE